MEPFYDDVAWREEAACLGHDQVLFFPEGLYDVHKIAAAKAICASCPVSQECLDYALESNQTEGIWGGFTVAERRKLRRDRLRRAS